MYLGLSQANSEARRSLYIYFHCVLLAWNLDRAAQTPRHQWPSAMMWQSVLVSGILPPMHLWRQRLDGVPGPCRKHHSLRCAHHVSLGSACRNHALVLSCCVQLQKFEDVFTVYSDWTALCLESGMQLSLQARGIFQHGGLCISWYTG